MQITKMGWLFSFFLVLTIMACGKDEEGGIEYDDQKSRNENFTYFTNDQLWADALRLDATAFTPGQFEWWYTDGHLSNGVTFVASYHIRINEEGINVPYVTLNFANSNGVVQDEQITFDVSESSFDKDVCDVKIGNHYLKAVNGFDRYEIFVDPQTNNGNGLHLFLDKVIPSYAPGVDNGENVTTPYFRWVCAVPNGKLSGTVTINGVEENVTGSGYHDHNWGNVPMGVLVNDWHWARGEADEFTAVTASVTFNNGVTVNNAYVAHPEYGVLVSEANEKIEFDEDTPTTQPHTGKAINSNIVHVVNGYNKGSIQFKGNDILSSFKFDEDVNYEWWYTRFDAELIIKLNIEGDEIQVKSPHAILEHMDFKGKEK